MSWKVSLRVIYINCKELINIKERNMINMVNNENNIFRVIEFL